MLIIDFNTNFKMAQKNKIVEGLQMEPDRMNSLTIGHSPVEFSSVRY